MFNAIRNLFVYMLCQYKILFIPFQGGRSMVFSRVNYFLQINLCDKMHFLATIIFH